MCLRRSNSRDVGGTAVGEQLAAAQACLPQEIPMLLLLLVVLVPVKLFHQRIHRKLSWQVAAAEFAVYQLHHEALRLQQVLIKPRKTAAVHRRQSEGGLLTLVNNLTTHPNHLIL